DCSASSWRRSTDALRDRGQSSRSQASYESRFNREFASAVGTHDVFEGALALEGRGQSRAGLLDLRVRDVEFGKLWICGWRERILDARHLRVVVQKHRDKRVDRLDLTEKIVEIAFRNHGE